MKVERSARYGPQPKNALEWVDIDWKTSNDHTKDYFTLNRYILDDTLPSGNKADFQQYKRQAFTNLPIDALTTLRQSNKKRELLTLVIKLTVNCRIAQYMMDGNHRTSILLLFELLHAFDISSYQLDPLQLYVLYSNCCQDDWDSRRQSILNYCMKRAHAGPGVSTTLDQKKSIRFKIKNLWYWNSWFEVMSRVEQNWILLKSPLTSSQVELKEEYLLKLNASKRSNLACYRCWRTIHRERD